MAATRVAPVSGAPVSTAPREGRAWGGQTLALAAMVVVALALLAGAGFLWVVHGPAVFFDTLASGLSGCL
ncbi:hypothetical protein [Roseixanthobacter glucoisosaccharinicivorans]|uniref:hypothetical protein n=1 Tax=Roseixanthobacter glucoisosaccharinicivorans TaxID=3119923 RepID=UPI003729CDF8